MPVSAFQCCPVALNAVNLACMADGDDDEVPERPATWENVVTGEAKHLLGEAIGDEELAEEGDEQKEIAHEVHSEYDREHDREHEH